MGTHTPECACMNSVESADYGPCNCGAEAEDIHPTIQDFIKQHNITIQSVRVPENPNFRPDPKNKDDVKWHKEAAHWHCTMTINLPKYDGHGRAQHSPVISTYYSQGSGNATQKVKQNPLLPKDHWRNQEKTFPLPKVEEVLDILASDACGYDNSRSFEEWCGDYGYDTDSRRAEKIYNLNAESAKQLRQWMSCLGPEAYTTLLFDIERL
jgi:hypothetical protein